MTTENDMVDAILLGCEDSYQSILDDYTHSLYNMSQEAQDIYYAVVQLVSMNKYDGTEEFVGCNTGMWHDELILRRERLNRMCEAYMKGEIL